MISIICDLDGVIYRGRSPISGSPEALTRLIDSDVELFFATNNSTRTPAEAVAKIRDVTGVEVPSDNVFTSAQAAARVLRQEDDPVLIVGESGIVEAVHGLGLETTQEPAEARAVVVGLYRDLSYDSIAGAADAVRRGARFIATNTDPTFPTATGLKPGSGAIVTAIAVVAGRQPEVCGKPHAPMRKLIKSRVTGDEVWVIGDRVDTDIALAEGEPSWRSILVMTGVTGPGDHTGSAHYVAADFAAAVDVVLDGRHRR